MAHRQHVPFGGVFHFPRGSIRTHQPERALLLAVLQKGPPKLRDLWLEAGLGKVVELAADDLFPRKTQQLSSRRRWRPGNCRRRRRSGSARKGDRRSPGRATPVLSDRSQQANRRLMAVSRRNPSRSHLSGVEPVDQCRLRDKIGPRRDYTARTIGRREPQPACILPPALSSPTLPNVIGGRDRSPVYGRDLCPTCDCGRFGHDRRPNIRQNSAVHRGEVPPSVSRYMPDASSSRRATYSGCPKGTSSRRSMNNPHPDSGAVP